MSGPLMRDLIWIPEGDVYEYCLLAMPFDVQEIVEDKLAEGNISFRKDLFVYSALVGELYYASS